MITLKELVQNQAWTDATDIQIIKAYFEMNDLESDGIDIISELTKSKINKIKNIMKFFMIFMRMVKI